MNITGHFATITAHKWRVMKYCFASGLYWQGILHDLSKYSPTEFLVGVTYFQGDRSPNDQERKEKGCSYAWLHHKGRNKHHIEYWIDYTPHGDHCMGGMEMPTQYVYEMVCDRIAASEIYLKDAYTSDAALAYYERGKHHYMLHPKTRALLEELLTMVATQGEAATCAEMKRRNRAARQAD